jgi:TonB family protein
VRVFAVLLKWVLPILGTVSGLTVAQTVPRSQAGTQTFVTPAVTTSPAVSYRFDIAAQPLADALDQYGAITRRPVIFDATVVAGRTSAAVQGMYAPEVALRMLVEGTGLMVDYTGAGRTDAFVLRAIDAPEAASNQSADDTTDLKKFSGYAGLIQIHLWDTFCRIPQIQPGEYSTAVRFSIDLTGRIINAQLLHSTGDHDRDMAVLITLDQVQFDTPPPAEMPQPITMVILPLQPTPEWQCRSVQ